MILIVIVVVIVILVVIAILVVIVIVVIVIVVIDVVVLVVIVLGTRQKQRMPIQRLYCRLHQRVEPGLSRTEEGDDTTTPRGTCIQCWTTPSYTLIQQHVPFASWLALQHFHPPAPPHNNDKPSRAAAH